MKLKRESADFRFFAPLQEHYGGFHSVAAMYAGLGDKDRAFEFLERGYEQQSAGMPFLELDPFWDNLRSDPRFQDLLRRMGLRP